MKKILFAVLAAAAVFTQTALAENRISVAVDSFTFDVSFTSDANTQRPTIQLLDEQRSRVVYIGEGVSVQSEDDTYVFQFKPFNVPKNLETGSYIVRIGGTGVETVEETIYFVNILDKSKALNLLNDAGAEQVESVLRDNQDKLGVELTDYLALDPQWRGMVNQAIAALSLANDGSGEQVNEKHQLFLRTFSEKMETAVIAGVKEPKKVLKMLEQSRYLGLDKETWYSRLGENKLWAAEVLAETDFPLTVTKEELMQAYNGAVLTGIIANCDWGTGKEALSYFSKAGLIQADVGRAEALPQTNMANVFKDLKNARIRDYRKLPEKYDELVKKYTPSSSGNGGGSTGGGGGGAVIPMQPQSTPGPVEQPEQEIPAFHDLDTVEWAREAIESLARKGVLSGDGSGVFAPGRFVTREEFSKMMVSAFSLFDPSAVCSFTDVPEGTWYYPYVASARQNGIISGISSEEFGTGQSITRQDMAVILNRVYAMGGYGLAGEAAEFLDEGEIADYAKPAVAALSAAGILRGTENDVFSPRQGVTRAQGAKAIYELLQAIGG